MEQTKKEILDQVNTKNKFFTFFKLNKIAGLIPNIFYNNYLHIQFMIIYNILEEHQNRDPTHTVLWGFLSVSS